MFCSSCGTSDQSPETYCRKCGLFLRDPEKPVRKERSPDQHVKANVVLSSMTIVVSFTLAALIVYNDFGWPNASALNYMTAGFLVAIGSWNIQTLIRTMMLRKQLKDWGRLIPAVPALVDRPVNRALKTADLTDAVPASVTEGTTRHLVDTRRGSSETQQ